VSKATTFAAPRPVVTHSYNLPELEPDAAAGGRDQSAVRPNPSLHQSPPPVSPSVIPPGAIASPPDSAQNSSDDEAGDKSKRRRERQLDNLEELQEAIRVIDFRRESSPDGNADSGWHEPDEQRVKLALQVTKPPMFESPTECQPPSSSQHTGQALSKEARRISHSRSTTETSIFPIVGKKTESSDSSDTDDDAYRLKKPAMVRKKSGELVKPALRPSSSRRPSSMPGTPTYSKAVHFDSHLEHVRHFLQVDKPLAVSAGSSPVEAYEGDAEFPFGSDDSYPRSPPFEWEIILPNFPKETTKRKSLPVRVERVFLSNDNKTLIGIVACANLAFTKHVVARFTLDYWKTTSEVIAEYNNDVRRKQQDDGYDRFNFNIKLEDQANLEKKTLFFCIRYNVIGQEFWDNNNSFNYQVDFRKKEKLQNGKNGTQGVGTRTRTRPTPSNSSGRPVSLPASFDDFIDSLDARYDFSGFRKQPPSQAISSSSNSTQHLKDTMPANSTTTKPRANRPGQAFGNRYDFEASLSAAIQAANRPPDSGSGTRVRGSKSASGGKTAGPHGYSQPAPTNSPSEPPAFAGKGMSWLSNAKASSANASIDNSPSTFNAEKLAIQSSSYNELLNKYCFVRQKRTRWHIL
jgi:Carbohydrate/starch-binding module (family 21)